MIFGKTFSLHILVILHARFIYASSDPWYLALTAVWESWWTIGDVPASQSLQVMRDIAT
jgi:hypothetical protein